MSELRAGPQGGLQANATGVLTRRGHWDTRTCPARTPCEGEVTTSHRTPDGQRTPGSWERPRADPLTPRREPPRPHLTLDVEPQNRDRSSCRRAPQREVRGHGALSGPELVGDAASYVPPAIPQLSDKLGRSKRGPDLKCWVSMKKRGASNTPAAVKGRSTGSRSARPRCAPRDAAGPHVLHRPRGAVHTPRPGLGPPAGSWRGCCRTPPDPRPCLLPTPAGSPGSQGQAPPSSATLTVVCSAGRRCPRTAASAEPGALGV